MYNVCYIYSIILICSVAIVVLFVFVCEDSRVCVCMGIICSLFEMRIKPTLLISRHYVHRVGTS